MCATCGLVSLRETWEACGGCPNGHADRRPVERRRGGPRLGRRRDAPGRRPAGRRSDGRPGLAADAEPARRTGLWIALGVGRPRARARGRLLAHARQAKRRSRRPSRPRRSRPRRSRSPPRSARPRASSAATDFRTPDGYCQDLYVFAADSSGRTLTFTVESDAFYPDLVVTGPGRARRRGRDRRRGRGRDRRCGASPCATLRGPGTYRILISSRRPAATGALHAPHPPGGARDRAPDDGPAGPGHAHDAQPAGRRPLPRHVQLRRRRRSREHTITVRSSAFTPAVTVTGPGGTVRGSRRADRRRHRLPLHARTARARTASS